MKKYCSSLLGLIVVVISILLSLSSFAGTQEGAKSPDSKVVAAITTDSFSANTNTITGVNPNVEFITTKVETLVTALSQKLGVAGEKVYATLLLKHQINGYFWLSTLCLLLLLLIPLSLLAKKFQKEIEENGGPSIMIAIGFFELIIPMAIILIYLIISFSDGFSNLMAPQIGAMEDMLKLVKDLL